MVLWRENPEVLKPSTYLKFIVYLGNFSLVRLASKKLVGRETLLDTQELCLFGFAC